MINEQTREHEIRCKIKLGIALSRKEESYYLLYMATHTERYQYVKSKKGEEQCNCKNKFQMSERLITPVEN